MWGTLPTHYVEVECCARWRERFNCFSCLRPFGFLTTQESDGGVGFLAQPGVGWAELTQVGILEGGTMESWRRRSCCWLGREVR